MSAGRLDRLALLASVAALAALQLWLRPLLPVDETRYLAVAWEMWWRGDFLLPWLNGEPYSHKPPLLFWLIHALWALFGVSELAARLLLVFFRLLQLWRAARGVGVGDPGTRFCRAVLGPALLVRGVELPVRGRLRTNRPGRRRRSHAKWTVAKHPCNYCTPSVKTLPQWS